MVDTNERVYLEMYKERFPGPVALIDVGAHSGDWTKYAQTILSVENCFLFEPNPILAEALRRLDRVVVIEAAVTDKDGLVNFLITPNPEHSNIFSASWDGEHFIDGSEGTKVRGITLDAYIGKTHTPILVKVDTEGAEKNVIRGAEKSLREHRIKAIQFEYGGTWGGYGVERWTLAEAVKMLIAFGYEVFRSSDKGIEILTVEVIDDFNGSCNIFAILPKEST